MTNFPPLPPPPRPPNGYKQPPPSAPIAASSNMPYQMHQTQTDRSALPEQQQHMRPPATPGHVIRHPHSANVNVPPTQMRSAAPPPPRNVTQHMGGLSLNSSTNAVHANGPLVSSPPPPSPFRAPQTQYQQVSGAVHHQQQQQQYIPPGPSQQINPQKFQRSAPPGAPPPPSFQNQTQTQPSKMQQFPPKPMQQPPISQMTHQSVQPPTQPPLQRPPPPTMPQMNQQHSHLQPPVPQPPIIQHQPSPHMNVSQMQSTMSHVNQQQMQPPMPPMNQMNAPQIQPPMSHMNQQQIQMQPPMPPTKQMNAPQMPHMNQQRITTTTPHMSQQQMQPPMQHQMPRPIPPQPPRHLQEKDKIDPSQIPRIPLFTRPHHAPSTIYPTISTPGTNMYGGTAIGASMQPPPADSRYVHVKNSQIVNPRLLRSTVYTFPQDGATQRKVGVPLGLVVSPLAGLTELCGKDGEDKDNDDTHDLNGGSQWNSSREQLDYIPIITDPKENTQPSSDPERIPVLRSSKPINPPRCNRCHAYLNPFCTSTASSNPPQHQSYSTGAYYTPIQQYNCNLCSTKNSISIPDEYISSGMMDKALRNGTVEYEVSGPYVVRPHVENVRIYGVEYVPIDLESESLNGLGGGGGSSTRNCYSWKEMLSGLKDVVKALREHAPPIDDGEAKASVKVGIFAYCQDMLVFPYIKSKGAMDEEGVEEDADEDPPMEIGVSIVSDVEEDPFCPLPLKEWTYDVSGNDMDWIRFCHVVDSLTEIMEMLTSDCERKEECWVKNCGGAALAALVDALKESGGRATLITTRRPNFGVGALRDREAGQQSNYMKVANEKRLFTPLQHLTFTATALKTGEEKDRQASLFYKQLGEDAAKSRVSLDIIVASSLLKPDFTMGQHARAGAGSPNAREFLDVATLGELCRISCGRFKWLRVGNECGIAVDEKNDGNGENSSFTSEQLREELKRSALAYMGSDAVFKLRCSNGIQVKSYSPTVPFGRLVGDGIVDSAELELASIDSSTAVAVLLEHKIGGITNTLDAGKKDSPMVFFQSAVLYTTLTGKRRVRVSTIGLPTTKVAADVFRSADLGAVATVMTRQAVSDANISDDGLKSARFKAFDQCVTILANYRLHTNARTSSSGQLILPESLQLLPLFCLSLRKSRMFRHCLQTNSPSAKPSPTADERAYHIFYASMVSPNIALQCIHPNVFQVSDLRACDGEWIAPPVLENNKFVDEDAIATSKRPVCQLPKSTNPSMTCLDESGMYILDDRFALYLFVGKDVPQEKWSELISFEPNNDAINGNYHEVPVGALSIASTDAGSKVRSILRQLRMMNAPNPTLALTARPTYAPLISVFVGRGASALPLHTQFEGEMDSLLIDDPDSHEKSYVDFLCTIHRAIRDKNSNAE